MTKIKIILSVIIVVGLLIQPTSARVDIGVSFDEDGLKGFHLAIGEHYNVPENEIVIVKKKKIPEEELPVLFFLASKAGVKSRVIIDMRLGGKSWMEITRHFGLSAGIFHVEVNSRPGPPYGKAYGHFKNKSKKKWKEINLTDGDIVNFVNLKFMSNHYGYSPDEIIEMRAKGRNFIEINQTFKERKKAGKDKYSQKAHKLKEKPKKCKINK